MTKRCALYLRVSTEQQVDGNSLATQRALLLRQAKARGYLVADVYIDAGLSGKNMDRPELQRLIEDAQRQKFDLVLVWKVDRVSRSMRDLMNLIAILREHGVEFAAVDQQFDTGDPVGVLTLHILGSFAQFEREMLVERTKEGHLQRLRRRDWSCGPVPFGYRKESGRLIEVPAEAKVVRRIFRLFLDMRSLRGVAARLNRDRVPSRKGGAWTGGTVGQILQNPVYAGANVYGRHRKGDTRLRPQEEWTVIPGMRAPLVEPTLLAQVRALLDGRVAQRSDPRPAESYLLSGVVRCGKCGSAMCGSSQRKDGKVYRYYRCNGSQHRGKSHCSGMSVSADVLEKAVKKEVRGPAQNTPTAQTVAEGARETETEERKETRRALDKLRERTARLFDLYELGQIEKGLFQERMAGLSVERDRLTAALKASAERDDACVVPDSATAVAGVVKVIIEDKRAQVYLASGKTSRVSLLPECDTTTFGGRLKAWRLREGLMQRDVARMLGVDVCSVRNWEAGRCAPRQKAQEQVLLRLRSRGGGA